VKKREEKGREGKIKEKRREEMKEGKEKRKREKGNLPLELSN
jgi:hypothetical protein